MTHDLPAELKAALERKAQGVSRKDAAQRADTISKNYRGGGDSKSIKTEEDALAYALSRMPATYAAIAACLNAIMEIRADFKPVSLLDIGAGPGTATWAAAEAFSSLNNFKLLDSNPVLRELAVELSRSGSRLTALNYSQGNAEKLLDDASSADLVIASYLIGELSNSGRMALADAMWAKTNDTLLIVEPGTPNGYARIIEMRTRLIVKGARAIAPCPHDNACPLIAPDWCHFSQRLARSRAHKHLKGAELPYEDEKFSYVALTRTNLTERPSRVLAQPKVTKIAVTAKLCAKDGVKIENVPHRDKQNYSRARKINWGDAIFGTPNSTPE